MTDSFFIPLVSVLLPVYNGEKYLREAIESILNQTYNHFEFLIINDGSTDATEEIILSYNDPRIRYVKNQQNLKLIASLNKGLDLAKGKYIARMDADDVSLPERLEQQVDFMEKNQDYVLVGSRISSFGNEQNFFSSSLEHSQICQKLFFNNCIYHSTVMINNNLLAGMRYDKSFIHVEDYELWTRLIGKGKMKVLDSVLLKYRVHNDSICQNNYLFQHEMVKKIREKILCQYGVCLRTPMLDSYNKLVDNATNSYYRNLEPIDQYSRIDLFNLHKIITEINKSKKPHLAIKKSDLIFQLRTFMYSEFVESKKLKGIIKLFYLTSVLFSFKQFSKKNILKWIVKN